MEDLNPYQPGDSEADTKDSDRALLPRAISLMGTISFSSLVAMIPLVFLHFLFPPWIFIIVLVGFFVPMAINMLLLLVLLVGVMVGDVGAKYQRFTFRRTPPWESPRHIDEMHDSRWYDQLLARLRRVEQLEGIDVPAAGTLLCDKETNQHWLNVMGSQGFATYDLLVPTSLEELRPRNNPFADPSHE